MKEKLFLILIIMNLFVLGNGIGRADVPVIFVENDHFKSESVLEGTEIVHEFIISNKGTGLLRIEKVKTGCGCVATTYTRKITSGSNGKVAIKLNTSGYGGRKLSKIIRVESNDPQKRVLRLRITAQVEKFAFIEPKMVILRGGTNEEIKANVLIIPRPEYPFKINGIVSNNLKGKVEHRLEEKQNQYLLIIKNLHKNPGNYNGRIYLKTNHPAQPEIVIRVFGNIKKQVTYQFGSRK